MHSLLPALADAYGDVQVIAPDMRGVNRTEPKVRDPSFYSPVNTAMDLPLGRAPHRQLV